VTRTQPRVYFLPVGSFDPTAPTMQDLEQGVDISHVVTIGVDAEWDDEREARNRAIADAAATAGQYFADMEAALLAFGEAVSSSGSRGYVMPSPKPWAGNIATQKRRRKL